MLDLTRRTASFALAKLLVAGVVGLFFSFLADPPPSHAQLISIKTAPVATGSQFAIYPSEHRAMGGVSIALDDQLADPFVNPAKATRTRDVRLFSTPSYYQMTGQDGGARTMPLGALLKRDQWFGGLSVAVQELWGAESPSFAVPYSRQHMPLLRERANNNLYVTGLFGKDLSDSDASLAGSAFYASLNALDGVDLLYPNSAFIEQFGYMADVRVGVLEEGDDGTRRELVFLFNRLSMTHDVYRRWPSFGGERSSVQENVDRNLDRTNTAGVEYRHSRSLDDAWRVGASVTANRKTHPKIPNYELMNIPRDPGNSWAFNAGIGLVGETDNVTFGMDVIYEPIFSHTWAKAASPIENEDGEVILRPGQKTVDNNFTFSNTIINTGLKRVGEWTEFQAGVQIHTIRYWLDQQRFVTDTQRDQYEGWTEWTAGVGAGLHLSNLTVRYQLQITAGTGRPGAVRPGRGGTEVFVDRAAQSGDFIPAPEGPLGLDGTQVYTHQLSVALPIY